MVYYQQKFKPQPLRSLMYTTKRIYFLPTTFRHKLRIGQTSKCVVRTHGGQQEKAKQAFQSKAGELVVNSPVTNHSSTSKNFNDRLSVVQSIKP